MPHRAIKVCNKKELDRPVSVGLKTSLSAREVFGSISARTNPTQCSQGLATAATFFRSCVGLAVTHEDGSHHSLHAPTLFQTENNCNFLRKIVF